MQGEKQSRSMRRVSYAVLAVLGLATIATGAEAVIAPVALVAASFMAWRPTAIVATAVDGDSAMEKDDSPYYADYLDEEILRFNEYIKYFQGAIDHRIEVINSAIHNLDRLLQVFEEDSLKGMLNQNKLALSKLQSTAKSYRKKLNTLTIKDNMELDSLVTEVKSLEPKVQEQVQSVNRLIHAYQERTEKNNGWFAWGAKGLAAVTATALTVVTATQLCCPTRRHAATVFYQQEPSRNIRKGRNKKRVESSAGIAHS